MSKQRFGLVEAGGTKFVLGVATDKDNIEATTRIDTTTPEETIGAMVDWFKEQGELAAIGIASFGPLELDKASPQWGHIGKTPKPHWSNADIAGPLIAAFGCSVAIDTDVNGAALAESLWGAGQGQRSLLYFTIGTGIGGGAIVDGRIIQGLSHPEMGHIRLPRHTDDLDFAGICPFHNDCLEGLANGPAVKARWGVSLSDLPQDHIGHDIIAFYIAQTVVTMQAIFEPGRIIFGGGVMATPGLIDRVRAQAVQLGGGYFRSDANEIVTLPGLGDQAGLLGALALAQQSLG
jgi:fructokinase